MVDAPLDPRPYTKVCLQYVTSAEFTQAPRPADSVVFPMGGTVYPFTRYREAINEESLLRRLDRPLGTCERDQYIPPRSGDMYRPNATVPERTRPNSRFVQELAFPKAAMVGAPYDCRQENDIADLARSPLPFNNATKQQRYAVKEPQLVRENETPQPWRQTSIVAE
jgi:hypothetical protein